MTSHFKIPKGFERTNADGFVKNRNTNVVINIADEYYHKILEQRKHQKEKDALNNKIEDLNSKIKALEELVKKALSSK